MSQLTCHPSPLSLGVLVQQTARFLLSPLPVWCCSHLAGDSGLRAVTVKLAIHLSVLLSHASFRQT